MGENAHMQANGITYARLGSDEEWLIGVQSGPTATKYAFAVVRDGLILLQGEFDVVPGEDLDERISMAIRDWKSRPDSWHALFHRGARAMNKNAPSVTDCTGKCPWRVSRAELRPIAHTWSWIVPKEQRARGCMLFRQWAEPPSRVHQG